MCDRFPRKFDVQTSYKPSNVNTKFPRATYHTIVPSTEELYCLNRESLGMGTNRLLAVIIQQIVNISICGQEAHNSCHPYMTDIQRYT